MPSDTSFISREVVSYLFAINLRVSEGSFSVIMLTRMGLKASVSIVKPFNCKMIFSYSSLNDVKSSKLWEGASRCVSLDIKFLFKFSVFAYLSRRSLIATG